MKKIAAEKNYRMLKKAMDPKDQDRANKAFNLLNKAIDHPKLRAMHYTKSKDPEDHKLYNLIAKASYELQYMVSQDSTGTAVMPSQ